MNESAWPFFNDPTRRPFEEKYSELPERWAVDEHLVSEIISRYSQELMVLLKEQKKFRLPGYFADRRSDEEYLYDLLDGWLIEDIVYVAWLEPRLKSIEPEVKVNYAGANHDRKVRFDAFGEITTEPDFVCKFPEGSEVKVELQMARKPRSSYDMKKSKIERATKAGNIVYLWVLLPTDEYFLLDPGIFVGREATPNPSWGGKEVYSVYLSEVQANDWGPYQMRSELPERVVELLRTAGRKGKW